MRRRSAQVQPISAVIITGIVVSLVGVAYLWGVPLIQKRSSMSEFQSMERFVDSLKSKVTELARSGAGEAYLDIQQGALRLVPYEGGDGNNTLVLEFVVEQPLIFPNTTIYLGTTGFGDATGTGTYGESSPAVTSLSSSQLEQSYVMKTRLRFRELLKDTAPKKGYIIALCKEGDGGCTEEASGNQRVTLSFNRNVNRQGEAENGGELVVSYIDVRLS